jgi:hypothetical protein
MILRLFRPRFHPGTIHTLYGAIVAQARRPEIYQEFGAADTVEGRFDMIVLHLVLVLRRLEREPQGAALGRALLDAFGRDMDHRGRGRSAARRLCAPCRRAIGCGARRAILARRTCFSRSLRHFGRQCRFNLS